MAFPDAEAFVDQALHGESECSEQIGSRPVERLADGCCVGKVCFNAKHAKAGANEVDRRGRTGESASDDGYIIWSESFSFGKPVASPQGES